VANLIDRLRLLIVRGILMVFIAAGLTKAASRGQDLPHSFGCDGAAL